MQPDGITCQRLDRHGLAYGARARLRRPDVRLERGLPQALEAEAPVAEQRDLHPQASHALAQIIEPVRVEKVALAGADSQRRAGAQGQEHARLQAGGIAGQPGDKRRLGRGGGSPRAARGKRGPRLVEALVGVGAAALRGHARARGRQLGVVGLNGCQHRQGSFGEPCLCLPMRQQCRHAPEGCHP